MVRSMMSQTTLPKSFWDYAFESAARILNMVPTKKVDKTPYEGSYILEWKPVLDGLPRPHQLILDKLELCRVAP
ncbi:hypothetical protein Tco_1513085 [Tanacetum coccineum]